MASSSSRGHGLALMDSDENWETDAKVDVAPTKDMLKRKDEEIRKITEQLADRLEKIYELQLDNKDLRSQITALGHQMMDDRLGRSGGGGRGPEIRESGGGYRGRRGQGFHHHDFDDVDQVRAMMHASKIDEMANLNEINSILNNDLDECEKINWTLEQDKKRLVDEVAVLKMKIRRLEGELQKLGGGRGGGAHGSTTNYKKVGKGKANSGGGGGSGESGDFGTMIVHNRLRGATSKWTPCPHAVPSTSRDAYRRDDLGTFNAGGGGGGAAVGDLMLVPNHREENEAVNSVQTVPQPQAHEESPVAAADYQDHVTEQGQGQTEIQTKADPEPQLPKPRVKCPYCFVTCCQPALDRHIASRHSRMVQSLQLQKLKYVDGSK